MPKLNKIPANTTSVTQDPKVTSPANALPSTAAPSDIGVSEPVTNPLNQSIRRNQGNLAARTLQLAELFTAFPLIFPSLIIQADNISKYGEKEEAGVIGFSSSIINVLSTPFRWIIHKYVAKQHDESDVSSNKRSFFYDDFFQRILHPNFVKEFISFLFNTRRTLFNFFPGVFITPSEEHDPTNPENKTAPKSLANLFIASSGFLSPIRWISSIATFAMNIPSYLSGTVSAYNGEQHLFNISKYFSRITDLFTPLTANLSALLSTAKALMDSSKGESMNVTFGRYNIDYSNILQGIFGGILSIPSFVGALVATKDILLEKEENSHKLVISNYVGELVGYVMPWLKSYGFFQGETVASSKNRANEFIEKALKNSKEHGVKLIESIYNSSGVFKKFFSFFRPVDISGNIIADQNSGVLESRTSAQVALGGFSKTFLFKELHTLLHPIQSLLMLLPSAFVPISDPYITDNAKVSLRLIDRLFGINSLILSIPNFIIYALSTRVPQVIIKVFELKQKYAKAKGLDYDAYEAFTKFKENLGSLRLPGITYLQKILNDLDIDSSTFQSLTTTNKLLEEIEVKAREQEPSTKASELLQAFRIGAKALLARQGIFFAKRDDLGLTDEEHSRMRIYNSVGTLKEGIARIPVIGWVAAPFIEMFRNIYYVKPRKNKRLPGTMPGTPAGAMEQLKALMNPQQPGQQMQSLATQAA